MKARISFTRRLFIPQHRHSPLEDSLPKEFQVAGEGKLQEGPQHISDLNGATLPLPLIKRMNCNDCPPFSFPPPARQEADLPQKGTERATKCVVQTAVCRNIWKQKPVSGCSNLPLISVYSHLYSEIFKC